MTLSTFATCLLAVTLLTLTPGVDTLLVIRNSVRGGWRDGLVTSFGICSALFIHALVSALGLSLLLLQTAWLFLLVKYTGAAYLIYLGICSIAQARRSHAGGFEFGVVRQKFSLIRSFREGMLSNLLNPKAIIFYLAFLPQFVDPSANALLQSMVVAATHFSVAMLYGLLLALLSGYAQKILSSPLYNRVFHAVSGSIIAGIGVKLALSRNL